MGEDEKLHGPWDKESQRYEDGEKTHSCGVACEVEPIRDIELSYPVMTREGFPYGMRCPNCDRSIKVGQPYKSQLYGVLLDGSTTTTLTCVYC
jgi:hypothetical protein